jgi:hypothetical protein
VNVEKKNASTTPSKPLEFNLVHDIPEKTPKSEKRVDSKEKTPKSNRKSLNNIEAFETEFETIENKKKKRKHEKKEKIENSEKILEEKAMERHHKHIDLHQFFPPLNRAPQTGDILAFKMYELNSLGMPELTPSMVIYCTINL